MQQPVDIVHRVGAGGAAAVTPAAWLVIAADGFRAVFLERVRAEQWAARCHGTVHALVLAEAEA